MPPSRTPNQIAEQWEKLGRSEEVAMGNDIKALEHLEEISSNLDDIRKENISVSSALLTIAKYLKEIAEKA